MRGGGGAGIDKAQARQVGAHLCERIQQQQLPRCRRRRRRRRRCRWQLQRGPRGLVEPRRARRAGGIGIGVSVSVGVSAGGVVGVVGGGGGDDNGVSDVDGGDGRGGGGGSAFRPRHGACVQAGRRRGGGRACSGHDGPPRVRRGGGGGGGSTAAVGQARRATGVACGSDGDRWSTPGGTGVLRAWRGTLTILFVSESSAVRLRRSRTEGQLATRHCRGSLWRRDGRSKRHSGQTFSFALGCGSCCYASHAGGRRQILGSTALG